MNRISEMLRIFCLSGWAPDNNKQKMIRRPYEGIAEAVEGDLIPCGGDWFANVVLIAE